MSAEALPDEVPSLFDRILDGAARAFAELGVRACTIEQIARQAGVSRITVYRHVGPKAEVFRQLALRNTRSYFSKLEERFREAEQLSDIVRAVFLQAQEHYTDNALYATLIELEPEVPLRMVTLDAEGFYVQGIPVLAPYLEPFLAPGADARDAAEWIIRVGISVVCTAGHRLDPYDRDDLERLVAFTVDGLRP